jgi:hypothetical protein
MHSDRERERESKEERKEETSTRRKTMFSLVCYSLFSFFLAAFLSKENFTQKG